MPNSRRQTAGGHIGLAVAEGTDQAQGIEVGAHGVFSSGKGLT
jgi:hypothetical protein